MLGIGTPAPELALPDQDGRTVSLARFRGSKHVVLFFYPKDDTPVCVREACAFRDAHADLEARDAVVIGVSRDGAASHRAFAQRWKLPFLLLCDTDGAAHRVFGAMGPFGLWTGRVTYVIDKAGTVRGAFRALLGAEAHVRAALEALEGEKRGTEGVPDIHGR